VISSLRGFRDILPPESDRFARIEAAAREVFGLYGYRELRIPTLELKELFVKSTGDTTDIVEKEMYAFTDGGGREIANRPEGTPGVVRAYIEHNLGQTGRNAKFFYIGSMFRAERPQAGRFREFEQIGTEHIGNPTPAADAENISMLVRLLEKTGAEGCSVELNSLGCSECRKAYRGVLLAFLRERTEKLCDPCRGRLERNPLRALDCKTDAPWLKTEAPKLPLCPACLEHFDGVQRLLGAAGITYNVNPGLVRGLDYYTRTVFEVRSAALGSQDAVAGGGRYDDLVRSMGGPAAPAVGWAMGVDRLVMLLGDKLAPDKAPKAFVIALAKEAGDKAFELLTRMRDAQISADFSDFTLSLKSQLRSADKSGASFALLIGEDELKAGTVAVKPLRGNGEQFTIPAADAPSKIKEQLKGRVD